MLWIFSLWIQILIFLNIIRIYRSVKKCKSDSIKLDAKLYIILSIIICEFEKEVLNNI